MAILQANDFVGEYKVSQSRFTELTAYITKYEKFYLTRLLGADLYALFIADLTAPTPQVPQTARFILIFNEFNTIPSLDNTLIISEGIKTMLIQFIYFHYTRNSDVYNSITGQVKSSNENSVGVVSGDLIESYNKGIQNYGNIQEYIQADPVTYPEVIDSSVEYLSYASGI